MINFVSRDEKKAESISKVRHTVMVWTTFVLGIYLVVMAGMTGWSLLWNNKEKKASQNIENMKNSIANYSDAEVAVWKLAERTTLISDFMGEKLNFAEEAKYFADSGFVIIGWDADSSGKQSITASGDSPEKLKEFEVYIQNKYEAVKVERIMWSEETGWSGKFIVSGKKES